MGNENLKKLNPELWEILEILFEVEFGISKIWEFKNGIKKKLSFGKCEKKTFGNHFKKKFEFYKTI